MAPFFLVVLLAVSAFGASVDQCPPNLPRNRYLQAFGDFCFRFHLYDRREYSSAQRGCQHEGGLLAMPKTNETDWFIYQQLYSTYQHSEPTWIGLNDKQHESVFKWEDGTTLKPGDYHDWGDGQGPNHVFGGRENCVVIRPSDYYSWHDLRCSGGVFGRETHPFICQFDAVSMTTGASTPAPSSPVAPESSTPQPPTPAPSTPKTASPELSSPTSPQMTPEAPPS